MKKKIGAFLLSIAVGMLIMMFISNKFIGCIVIALLLVLGYNLYCCD